MENRVVSFNISEFKEHEIVLGKDLLYRINIPIKFGSSTKDKEFLKN
jgi:hypothetical protein